MEALGNYDTDLQMFVDGEHALDLARLRFLRWLAEQGKLEHETAGPPTGDLAHVLER